MKAINNTPANQRRMFSIRDEHRKNPTPSETHIETLLKQLGERFFFEKGFLSERSFFIVDFYLPKPRKLCLEIDGGYHARQIAYDKMRDAFFRVRRKMRVLRITNDAANALDACGLLALLDKHAPLNRIYP